MQPLLLPHNAVPDLAAPGVLGFVTTREFGSCGFNSSEPASVVSERWTRLMSTLSPGVTRLAVANQIHGDRIVEHGNGWQGVLRDTEGADGHFTESTGTALAVTLADCVPIFMVHPHGAIALLHSGWRGTVAGILAKGIERFRERGFDPGQLRVHLGPAICGHCYEVGPDVYQALTGQRVRWSTSVDLRAVLARQARSAGASVTVSEFCTRCHNDRFFSHRCGDEGRHLAVLTRLERS